MSVEATLGESRGWRGLAVVWSKGVVGSRSTVQDPHDQNFCQDFSKEWLEHINLGVLGESTLSMLDFDELQWIRLVNNKFEELAMVKEVPKMPTSTKFVIFFMIHLSIISMCVYWKGPKLQFGGSYVKHLRIDFRNEHRARSLEIWQYR